jgi:subtilisin family serine protease
LSRGNHGPWRGKRTPIFLALPLLVLGLSFAVSGVASGASGGKAARIHLGSTLKPTSTATGAKSPSGELAQTDPSLLGRTDSRPVNVMIKYDFDASASYTGDLAGLQATSPRVTGKSLDDNAAAVAAYDSYTATKAAKISASIQKAVPSAKIRQTFQTVYGGVAAQVPANSVAALLRQPGVVAVQKDALNHPLDDNTSFIGATNVWPTLGGQDNAGSNVVVGVIDTGVWPESPFFVDRGLPAPPHPLSFYHCDFGDGTDVAHLGPTFACNNKLIGAYNFTQTYMSSQNSDGQEFCNNATHVCSARDSEGHGTHTSSTAAGDRVDSAVLYGVQRGPVSGIAPGAHVIMFRVCLVNGCVSSDSVHAVQQAIHDGVNVLNFSISGGAQPYSDPVELAFLDATNAGISVNASAGNSGPGASTSDHGGPWTTTVGASTGPRSFTSTLHLTADGGASLDVPGVTLTNGISSATPVVMAATLAKAGGGLEDALCQSDLAPGAATGKVVVCNRGTNGRIDKGRRVLAGGAAGMILTNNSAAVTDLESDNHYLPAIQTQWNSGSIQTFVGSHTNVMATWAQGTASPAQADVMASFSSRGPLGDWIKPDVTAPGVQVLAGQTPQPDQTTADNGPPGNLFMAIAGTSMSSPHSAGVSALVKAAHPSWTPEMIKSALMTSSVQTVVKEDGVTPAGVFDMGAGSIRADRAVNPTLVFNETYANFVAAGSDPLHRIDLNLASVDATTMTGSVATQRTAMNVSGVNQTLDVNVTQPAGVTITVNNGRPVHVARDASVTFPITISAPDVANGQYQGRINLVPRNGGNTVTMPVAFVKKQGLVTLTNSCSPLSFPVTSNAHPSSTHCTVGAANFGSTPSNVSLTVQQRERGAGLIYKNVGAPGSVIGTGKGVQWSGTLSPAVPPQVTGLTNVTGNGPDGGYLDLGLFGVTPIAGVGDDTISNFNVPTFYYGGEPYTQIGVVSNGYVVVGGGTSSDIVYMPQHFPNAAKPNNVLAPLWTDLNPSATGGGNIKIATVNDGNQNTALRHTWLVVDYHAVKNFGNVTTHSFEIWLQLASGGATTGPSSEEITYSYAPNTTFPGDGGGLGNAAIGDADSGINWGAENRDGSSGANIASAPADGSEWRVNTTPPAAGGSVSIPFDIASKIAGTFHSDASMTSSTTPGTTVAPVTLTVTP